MATALITWVPTNGGSYEVWFAKLSVVGTTSLPPATGWTQATGSPFNSSLGTASITGLDDNTQYRIDVRADCTGVDSNWVDNIKYKLDCPALGVVANPVGGEDVGASVTATITLSNLVEYEAIVSSLVLTVKDGGNNVVQTTTFTSPYASSTLTYTFSNLLTGTNYNVVLQQVDGVGNVTTTCATDPITTQTPVVVPPPVCNPPTFAISNITSTTATISITSSLNLADTYDISLDGGLTYSITGQSPMVGGPPSHATVAVYQLTGLVADTSYKIVVRYHCASGGIGISTSQTFTTTALVIVGSVQMVSNINSTTAPFAQQGTISLVFTFPQATQAPLSIYLGTMYNTPAATSICSAGTGWWPTGTSLFTIPPGLCIVPPGYFPSLDVSGTSASPFVVNIPQGVTTYTATGIRTVASLDEASGLAWFNLSSRPAIGTSGVLAGGWTDLYIHINSPSSYTASFTLISHPNLPGLTLHNV